MTELHSRSTEWATPAQESAYGDLHKMRQLHKTLTALLNQASLELGKMENAFRDDSCTVALHPVWDSLQGMYDDLGNALHIAESNHRTAE